MGAAAYAIESRMTTHLGKPKDTLNVCFGEGKGEMIRINKSLLIQAFHTEMTRIFKQTMMRTPEEE